MSAAAATPDKLFTGTAGSIAARRLAAREQFGLFMIVVPAVVVIAFFLMVPIGWLAGLSLTTKDGGFTLSNYLNVFSDTSYAQSFWLTLWMAVVVTGLCAAFGYLLAYAISLMPGWAARVSLALVAVPFWTSVLVRTYSWLILLQNEGLVNRALIKSGIISAPLHMMYNLTGTLIGMIHIMLPFMVFPLYAGLRRIDPDYVKAASGLGASQLYAFWRIYFPLSLPGLIAGSVLVFVLSLGFYVTPALLGGGHVIVLPLVFERDINWSQSWGPATAAAVLFVAAILAIFALVSRFVPIDRLFER